MRFNYIVWSKRAAAGISTANDIYENYIIESGRRFAVASSLLELKKSVSSKYINLILVTSNNFISLIPFLLVSYISSNKIRIVFILHGYRTLDGSFFKAAYSYGSLFISKNMSRLFKIKYVTHSHLVESFYLRFFGCRSLLIPFSKLTPSPSHTLNKVTDVFRIFLAGRDVSYKRIKYTLLSLNLDAIEKELDCCVEVWVFSDIEINTLKDNRIINFGFIERAEYLKRIRTCHLFINICLLEPYGLAAYEAVCNGVYVITDIYSGINEEHYENIMGIVANKEMINKSVIKVGRLLTIV